jgi:hypothetical protein
MNPRGQQFLDALATRILVGDSAMGSRLYELGAAPSVSYDYLNIVQPDLVPDQLDGGRPEGNAQPSSDGDQRLAHDRERRRIGVAPATDEGDREPARLELRADLRPGAVDDDDLVTRCTPLEHVADRRGRDAPAELHHDSHQVVYSALSFT